MIAAILDRRTCSSPSGSTGTQYLVEWDDGVKSWESEERLRDDFGDDVFQKMNMNAHRSSVSIDSAQHLLQSISSDDEGSRSPSPTRRVKPASMPKPAKLDARAPIVSVRNDSRSVSIKEIISKATETNVAPLVPNLVLSDRHPFVKYVIRMFSNDSLSSLANYESTEGSFLSELESWCRAALQRKDISLAQDVLLLVELLPVSNPFLARPMSQFLSEPNVAADSQLSALSSRILGKWAALLASKPDNPVQGDESELFEDKAVSNIDKPVVGWPTLPSPEPEKPADRIQVPATSFTAAVKPNNFQQRSYPSNNPHHHNRRDHHHSHHSNSHSGGYNKKPSSLHSSPGASNLRSDNRFPSDSHRSSDRNYRPKDYSQPLSDTKSRGFSDRQAGSSSGYDRYSEPAMHYTRRSEPSYDSSRDRDSATFSRKTNRSMVPPPVPSSGRRVSSSDRYNDEPSMRQPDSDYFSSASGNRPSDYRHEYSSQMHSDRYGKASGDSRDNRSRSDYDRGAEPYGKRPSSDYKRDDHKRGGDERDSRPYSSASQNSSRDFDYPGDYSRSERQSRPSSRSEPAPAPAYDEPRDFKGEPRSPGMKRRPDGNWSYNGPNKAMRLSDDERRLLIERGACLYCRKPGHTIDNCRTRPARVT